MPAIFIAGGGGLLIAKGTPVPRDTAEARVRWSETEVAPCGSPWESSVTIVAGTIEGFVSPTNFRPDGNTCWRPGFSTAHPFRRSGRLRRERMRARPQKPHQLEQASFFHVEVLVRQGCGQPGRSCFQDHRALLAQPPPATGPAAARFSSAAL